VKREEREEVSAPSGGDQKNKQKGDRIKTTATRVHSVGEEDRCSECGGPSLFKNEGRQEKGYAGFYRKHTGGRIHTVKKFRSWRSRDREKERTGEASDAPGEAEENGSDPSSPKGVT